MSDRKVVPIQGVNYYFDQLDPNTQALIKLHSKWHHDIIQHEEEILKIRAACNALAKDIHAKVTKKCETSTYTVNNPTEEFPIITFSE